MISAILNLLVTIFLPFLSILASLILFLIYSQSKKDKLRKIAIILLGVPLILIIPGTYLTDGIFTGSFASILFYALPVSLFIFGLFAIIYAIAIKKYKIIWLGLGSMTITALTLAAFALMLSGMN